MIKCREFQSSVAEWVAGRLQGDAAERMKQHEAQCAECADEAENERSLRVSFSAVPAIKQTPDLWERIERRVETTPQTRFAFRFPKMFAWSGAAAACAVLSIMILTKPNVVSPPQSGNPEIASGQKPDFIAGLHEFRTSDTMTVSYTTETSGDAAHMLLAGGQDVR